MNRILSSNTVANYDSIHMINDAFHVKVLFDFALQLYQMFFFRNN